MSYSKEELAKYRIERAMESLEEAILLSKANHWNTTANRLYYACFYAASAYLVANSLESFTHNGAKSSFNKYLIRTDLINREFGLIYNKLFNLRQEADYRDYRDLKKEDILPMLEEVRLLVQAIDQLLGNK